MVFIPGFSRIFHPCFPNPSFRWRSGAPMSAQGAEPTAHQPHTLGVVLASTFAGRHSRDLNSHPLALQTRCSNPLSYMRTCRIKCTQNGVYWLSTDIKSGYLLTAMFMLGKPACRYLCLEKGMQKCAHILIPIGGKVLEVQDEPNLRVE